MEKWFRSINMLVQDLYNNEFKNTGSTPIEKTIIDLLVANFTLWGFEDQARRKDVSDNYIADLKRKIDKENQRRNDLIDTIDALVKKDIVGTVATVPYGLWMITSL